MQQEIDRFWSKVDRRGPDECWPWLAGLKGHKRGEQYGVFSTRAGKVRAHRYAWVVANGPIAGRFHVLHECDNPRCCNPKHLFLGTHADNMADMVRKGRAAAPSGDAWRAAHPPERHKGGWAPQPGEKHPCALFTDAEVREIKREIAAVGGRRGICAEIGRRFGVPGDTIQKIKQGKNWPHVTI